MRDVRPVGGETGHARGFTLVEVLVSLAIAGTVALLAHVGLVVASDLSASGARTERATLRAAAARRQLAGWFRHLRSRADSAGRAFAVRDARSRGAADDAVVLPTLAADPLALRPALVRLHIDRDSATARRGLVAEVTHEVGTGRAGTLLKLAPGATGMDVRVLYRVDGRRRWFRGWTSLVRAPWAVRVRLSGENLAGPLRRPLLVVLPGGR